MQRLNETETISRFVATVSVGVHAANIFAITVIIRLVSTEMTLWR